MRRLTSRSIASFTIVLSLGLVACSIGFRDTLSQMFGPPAVALQEAYQSNPNAPTFDHSLFDGLLKEHVDENGWIDYAAIHANTEKLDSYLKSIASAPFDDFDRNEKLAFLINAYNAFTLRLILDNFPIKSIRDIPKAKRWDAVRWKVASHTWSLNQIEHEQIRPKFAEPRIHFALVCAAVGCPKLRNEAYRADRLEDQLEDQTRYVHTHDRWFQINVDKGQVRLTKLYDWYGSDFKQQAGSVLKFAAKYSSPLKSMLDDGRKVRVKYLPYDWSLNDKSHAN